LQILEDGRLTDAQGRTVDFRNTVLIMTANVGAQLLKKNSTLGFQIGIDGAEKAEYEAMRDKIMGELRRTFRPEFLNRVDETIVFHSLGQEHLRRIVGLMVDEVAQRLVESGITLTVTDGAREHLATEGSDPEYGARPLRRAIQHLVEDPLAEAILRGEFAAGATILVDVDPAGGKLTIKAG
jgi:ATP-dependent Clp protease ATP-binding subunit ClpC